MDATAPKAISRPARWALAVSGLLRMLEGGHHGVKSGERDQLIVRLWLDCGAPYPGTYAALGPGMIGGYERNEQVIENDFNWPETRAAAAAMARRCTSCHQSHNQPLPRALSDETGFSFWMPDLKDSRIRRNRHIVFNLTRPDKSLLLLAPLAKSAGGHGACHEDGHPPGEGAVFTSTGDPDYQAILSMCVAGQRRLDAIKRFDMSGFRPRAEWIGEMKRFGILAPNRFRPRPDRRVCLRTGILEILALSAAEGGRAMSVRFGITIALLLLAPAKASPVGIALSSDGSRIFVAMERPPRSDGGWFHNGCGCRQLAYAHTPRGLAITADGSRLFVPAGLAPGRLLTLDSSNGRIID